MAHDARAQAHALADVDRRIVLAIEKYTPAPRANLRNTPSGSPARRLGAFMALTMAAPEHRRAELPGDDAGKLVQRLGVAHRPVAGRCR